MAVDPRIAPLVRRLALGLLLALTAPAADAVEPDEILADPAMEARARVISQELRCVVCQNQSIDDSNAELARDMRLLVRERLQEGDSNQQVLDYMVSRYGDFVLLTPPLKATTVALWAAPVGLAALAGFAAVAFFRRQRPAAGDTAAAPLSEEEARRLQALLKEETS